MTIQKTITLYTFDELPKEIQKKVIERFQNSEEHYFLGEQMQEKIDELLKENNIVGDAKVMYSLSYCQGDGAMFEGSFVWNGYNIPVKQSGHYYHYNSKSIGEITTIDGEEITDSKKYQDIENEFNALYVEICQKLAKWGYSCIESDLEESNIIENIKANEYTFTIDGRIESM